MLDHDLLETKFARIGARLKVSRHADLRRLNPGGNVRLDVTVRDGRRSVVTGLRRISRPGRRRYVSHEEIPRVLGGMGTAILSTSAGVMTGHEAKQRGVGGEVVAYVW